MLLADDPRAALGRNGDRLIAHITPKEAALLKKRGGSGTKNPRTGLLEFWDGGDGEGPGDDGSSGRSSEVTPGIAGEVDPDNESGYGPGYSGPGMANPGFFSDPFGWAAYQAQQMVANPVSTLANVGLSPLGLPYASQALNGLAEAIGNGIGKGVDALGISQSNGPGTVGPAGSVAAAGGGVDPVTGQPVTATSAQAATDRAAPAQAAAIRQAQAAQTPAAQASRMAYGLLGDPRSAPPAAGAGVRPAGGDQRRGRVTVNMLPSGPQRQGLLYG